MRPLTFKTTSFWPLLLFSRFLVVLSLRPLLTVPNYPSIFVNCYLYSFPKLRFLAPHVFELYWWVKLFYDIFSEVLLLCHKWPISMFSNKSIIFKVFFIPKGNTILTQFYQNFLMIFCDCILPVFVIPF